MNQGFNFAGKVVLITGGSSGIGRSTSIPLDPRLPRVSAALVQIQQVLLNLIMNALDAVEQLPPSERRVVIKTRSDNRGFPR